MARLKQTELDRLGKEFVNGLQYFLHGDKAGIDQMFRHFAFLPQEQKSFTSETSMYKFHLDVDKNPYIHGKGKATTFRLTYLKQNRDSKPQAGTKEGVKKFTELYRMFEDFTYRYEQYEHFDCDEAVKAFVERKKGQAITTSAEGYACFYFVHGAHPRTFSRQIVQVALKLNIDTSQQVRSQYIPCITVVGNITTVDAYMANFLINGNENNIYEEVNLASQEVDEITREKFEEIMWSYARWAKEDDKMSWNVQSSVPSSLFLKTSLNTAIFGGNE